MKSMERFSGTAAGGGGGGGVAKVRWGEGRNGVRLRVLRGPTLREVISMIRTGVETTVAKAPMTSHAHFTALRYPDRNSKPTSYTGSRYTELLLAPRNIVAIQHPPDAAHHKRRQIQRWNLVVNHSLAQSGGDNVLSNPCYHREMDLTGWTGKGVAGNEIIPV